MAFEAAGINSMLDHIGTEGLYLSLHTDDPAGDGAHEVTGGTPAYIRKAVTWGAANAKSMAASNQPVFDVPAGTTVKFVGLWSAESNGTFYGSCAVTNEAFAGQGTYTLTSTTLSGS